MTLTLSWVPAYGAVKFTVTGVLDDLTSTVKRVTPGGILQSIRGFPDGTWHTTVGQGYDFEMPLGVTVRYAYVNQDKTTLSAGDVTATIYTESPGRTNGEAWLRDVQEPVLSQPITVISTDDEVFAARQTVLEVSGRANPYVVWDSRSGRQGMVTLRVANDVVGGVWDDSTKRDKLEALFNSGRPLLLSMCASKGFDNAYLAIDAVTFTRLGNRSAWDVQLDYFEVDNPTGLQVTIPVEVTYTLAQQLPPAALYSDWATTDYFTVATRTAL